MFFIEILPSYSVTYVSNHNIHLYFIKVQGFSFKLSIFIEV